MAATQNSIDFVDASRLAEEINSWLKTNYEREDFGEFSKNDEEFLEALEGIFAGKKQVYYEVYDALFEADSEAENQLANLGELNEKLDLLLQIAARNNLKTKAVFELHKLHGFLRDKQSLLKQISESVNVIFADEQIQDMKLKAAKIDELQTQADALQTQANKLQTQTDEAHKKIEESRAQYVAILGIFAAVVMGFAGALGVSASMFSQLGKASVSELLIVFIAAGMLFGNVLNMLLRAIKQPDDGSAGAGAGDGGADRGGGNRGLIGLREAGGLRGTAARVVLAVRGVAARVVEAVRGQWANIALALAIALLWALSTPSAATPSKTNTPSTTTTPHINPPGYAIRAQH